ncbi:MAG: hypothetical protein SOH91_05725 [Lactobacillus delbrueckii]
MAYLGLAACLLFSSKLREYGTLIWTLSSGIIFTTLGCEWLYAIHEEYGYLALRNICFQVLSLILLLTYVKDESDLLLYAWTTMAGSAGANLINFLRLRKYFHLALFLSKAPPAHPRLICQLSGQPALRKRGCSPAGSDDQRLLCRPLLGGQQGYGPA